MKSHLSIAIGWLVAVFSTACSGQQIQITSERPSGIYALGEQVSWHVHVLGPAAASVAQANYVLKEDGYTVMSQGTLDLSSGSAELDTSLNEPGTILCIVTANAGDDSQRVLAGAAIAPDQIQPCAPPPDDFDDFWARKVSELEQIPADPKLEPADSGDPRVQYFKITMNNIHGSHIYGQLARPAADGKFPALLITQWAGVYGLPKYRVVDPARQGWLALNIMPHDIPFDRPDDYYKQLFATSLKNYWSFGSADRDSSYFLRMYLSCYRAAEYLSQRPDWDGKTLVVMGTSQGGQQAIMLGGLFPGITAVLANVPSDCDMTGPLHGRAIGYPNWADQAALEHNPKILETGRYYDPVNFARHIKCPALIAMGLIDETSPPAGVLAAANQIKGREIVIMPNSNHQGDHNGQAPFNRRSEQWLNALRDGKPLP